MGCLEKDQDGEVGERVRNKKAITNGYIPLGRQQRSSSEECRQIAYGIMFRGCILRARGGKWGLFHIGAAVNVVGHDSMHDNDVANGRQWV